MNEKLMKLAEQINLKIDSAPYSKFELPISKIDNVKVNAFVCKNAHNNSQFFFKIESDGAPILVNDEESEYTEHLLYLLPLDNAGRPPTQTIYELLLKIKEDIPLLRFDPFNSKLTKEPVLDLCDLFQELIDAPNVEKCYGECCVCYTNTRRATTSCNHWLCIKCTCDIDYNEEYEKLCPICRKVM